MNGFETKPRGNSLQVSGLKMDLGGESRLATRRWDEGQGCYKLAQEPKSLI